MRIVFVIDAGKYEWPSVLLAASERLYAGGCTGLTACVPAPRRELISETILSHHAAQGVGILEIGGVADHFAPRYDHGNKVLAAAAMAGRGPCVFMDSDTVFFKDTHLPDLLGGRTLAGARATGPAGPLPTPPRGTAPRAPPVCPPLTPSTSMQASSHGPPHWSSALPNLRPRLDQVALGTLAASLPTGWVHHLDKTYNYSIVHDETRVPIVPPYPALPRWQSASETAPLARPPHRQSHPV